MGLAHKLIGNKPGCLVPAESKQEGNYQHHKKAGKGKNNAQGYKKGEGVKRPSHNRGKKGLTRFSSDQFTDRQGDDKKSGAARLISTITRKLIIRSRTIQSQVVRNQGSLQRNQQQTRINDASASDSTGS